MNKPGSSADHTILTYIKEVEQQTTDPVERWALLKGMVVATVRIREANRKHQREYKQKKRAAAKESTK